MTKPPLERTRIVPTISFDDPADVTGGENGRNTAVG